MFHTLTVVIHTHHRTAAIPKTAHDHSYPLLHGLGKSRHNLVVLIVDVHSLGGHIGKVTPLAATVYLLKSYNIAMVIADSAGKWPYTESFTADFGYLRLHGLDNDHEQKGYTPRELEAWATRLDLWSQGKVSDPSHLVSGFQGDTAKKRNIFCYFDNDAKAYAPQNARDLLQLLSQRTEKVVCL